MVRAMTYIAVQVNIQTSEEYLREYFNILLCTRLMLNTWISMNQEEILLYLRNNDEAYNQENHPLSVGFSTENAC